MNQDLPHPLSEHDDEESTSDEEPNEDESIIMEAELAVRIDAIREAFCSPQRRRRHPEGTHEISMLCIEEFLIPKRHGKDECKSASACCRSSAHSGGEADAQDSSAGKTGARALPRVHWRFVRARFDRLTSDSCVLPRCWISFLSS